MINVDLLNHKGEDKLLVICDDCSQEFNRTKRRIVSCRKKWQDLDLCLSCTSRRTPKPQNSKDYWDEDKRQQHSLNIKSSESYYEAIKRRDSSGKKNSMYGKKLSKETKEKMSNSRTGKIGTNATAWKGGKMSLNCRVKKLLHTRLNWYKRVYERDGYTCTKCQAYKVKLDAHHIIPFSIIIKHLLNNTDKQFQSDEDRMEWLIIQPEVADLELKNGITLCRSCHKEAHYNWGSHNPNLKEVNYASI